MSDADYPALKHGIPRTRSSGIQSDQARHNEIQKISEYQDLVDLVNQKVFVYFELATYVG